MSRQFRHHWQSCPVRQMLTEEKGELTKTDIDAMKSIKNQELISIRTDTDVMEKVSPDQRIADKVALFGGSWKF